MKDSGLNSKAGGRKAAPERRSTAATGLEAAKTAFGDHARQIYIDGGAAAARDADRLEAIADRLMEAFEALEPLFDRLDLARDLTLYRGAVLGRQRAPYDAGALAELTATVISEHLLSGPAGSVLLAAVKSRSA
jgi:hypothetical protein